jgi:dTDP-4-dehydrorhamnose reductase
MKILLIGANGQLGSDLHPALEAAGHEVVALRHADFEITDPQSVEAALAAHHPAVVINTAAYHKVDEVEQNPEKAFSVNAIAPWRLACACQKMDAAILSISTDYVFGGDGARRAPYAEQDAVAPVNVYGVSKAAGEMLVRGAGKKHFVVRTSGLYGVRGASGKGGNFVELMLRLAREGKPIRVVDDQRLTPTHTPDLAKELVLLLETGMYGLYHITQEGDCSWYEFAAKIFEYQGLTPDLSPVPTAEFKTAAARPSYSVLAKAGIAQAGLPKMRNWQDALKDYLRARTASGRGGATRAGE